MTKQTALVNYKACLRENKKRMVMLKKAGERWQVTVQYTSCF
ncbi:hypothetical protein SAMN05660236_0306 [Ohtaekwangia koreensis]|uniref:Uncharacterized protein n=1 Tax=Ohtaekwangia koreensis TaxID=688867 RepID=A0A1T5IR83_9BACT|nr:hypothetical protein SAMN05660236_0306 [Ohtaekwangia koreensis]